MTARDHGTDGRVSLAFALLSAATFGGSGPFAKALLDTGWSPSGAVLLRVGGAALVLLPWTLRALGRRRARGADPRGLWVVALYGVVAVAGAQICFFNAVQHLSVGVALLLEYLAPVLLVVLAWARSGQPPRRMTTAGTLLSIVGLVLVLDLTGGTDVSLIGVAWGLAAAVCLSVYFHISARTPEGVTPVMLAGGGLAVGAVAIGLLGAVGLQPLAASTGDVVLLDRTMSWTVPALMLIGVCSVAAYLAGIVAAGRLGSRVASFVGLTEVLFAVLFAWLLLGQLPVLVQLLGGVCIVAGVALVNADRTDPSDVHTAVVPLELGPGQPEPQDVAPERVAEPV